MLSVQFGLNGVMYLSNQSKSKDHEYCGHVASGRAQLSQFTLKILFSKPLTWPQPVFTDLIQTHALESAQASEFQSSSAFC